MRAVLLACAVVLCAGCFHDLGALRARGRFDGGPDTGGPEEIAPSVVAADPPIEGAFTCMLDGVVARGGTRAGLGRDPAGETGEVDRVVVSSCLRADFGSTGLTDRLLVSARATGPVCGDDCAGECGTAPTLHVFTGDGSTYRHHAIVVLGAELADHPIAIDSTIRDVILCRSDAPDGQDNVEIDYIAAFR